MSSEALDPEGAPLPGGDFHVFLQKLRVQGLLQLGLLDSPRFRSVPVNLPHARALLDDLAMLRHKTMNNLTPEEDQALEDLISELQAHYQEVARG